MTAHGTITWNELNSWDPDGAMRFYGEALGWTFEAMPMPGGTYWLIFSDGNRVGGLFPLTEPDFEGVPSHWLTYIEADNVDARVDRALAAGGSLMRPPFDVPGVGRIAIVCAPGGEVMGWMQSVAE
ncbi:VOC family protein [Methylobrevis albus]|uniref:VOC family protein n=1 Tax=Methylobrevis albus TaxID=2793297 RepID=A0A931MX59_9HYPH|nr:VOC family protein [Methylobrevis albus]MBH0238508.1 VOC family protein [Methylobrevis albus]